MKTSYEALYIFVEYNDDSRFFERIVKPLFQGKYDWIWVGTYAQREKKWEWISRFVRNIGSMNAEYIYTTDYDDALSVAMRKQEVQSKCGGIDEDRIVVVKMEIESWYLAGLDDTRSKELGIIPLRSTDNITKEQFNDLIPREFRESRIDFMAELLKYFDIEIAKQKNTSFRYFLDTYDC